MRIDDLNRTPLTQGTEKADQTAAQQRSGVPQKGGVTDSDHAEVSQLARALSASDPAKIEQLRLEVQSGTYSVSADVVAKAIVNGHLTE
jgi:anti-sigma28 factor (negative regulator of flagellin synthesis)